MPLTDTLMAKNNSTNRDNIGWKIIFAGKVHSVVTNHGAASQSGIVWAAEYSCDIYGFASYYIYVMYA